MFHKRSNGTDHSDTAGPPYYCAKDQLTSARANPRRCGLVGAPGRINKDPVSAHPPAVAN